jgi:hypothetical protein
VRRWLRPIRAAIARDLRAAYRLTLMTCVMAAGASMGRLARSIDHAINVGLTDTAASGIPLA